MCTCSLSMHNSFRDSLSIKLGNLVNQMHVLEQDWATDTRNGAIKETGTALYFNEFVEKLTAIETTLPKGGA